MIQEQVIPVNFGQGVDTKTDPKAVVAGKLLRLENAVFTRPNEIAKRNGYVALGSAVSDGVAITAPKMVKDFGDQLVVEDKTRFLTYSKSQNAWIVAGNYISTEVDRTVIDSTLQGSGYADSAVLGNYILHGWSSSNIVLGGSINTSMFAKVFASVVDIQTGNVIKASGVLSTASSASNSVPVRCVCLGGSVLSIFYVNAAATAVVCRIVTFSGSGVVSFGPELTVTTSFVMLSGGSGSWDILQTSTGATILYASTPAAVAGVTVSNINTAGAVTATANTADANRVPEVLHIAQTSNGNLWAYWTEATGSRSSGTIVYKVYTSTLGVVLAKTTATGLPLPYFASNMIAVNNSATQQTLYYGIYDFTDASVPDYTDTTLSVTVTSAGVVGSITLVANGVMPYSRPFTVNGFTYAVFVSRGAGLQGVDTLTYVFVPFPVNRTFFVLQLDPTQTIPVVAARFGSGVSSSQAILHVAVGFMPGTPIVTGSKFSFSCALEIQQLGDSDIFHAVYQSSLTATFAYTIDFDSADAYVATNVGGVQVLNGGMLSLYDGASCSEFGFHLIPEIIELNQSDADGSIANGLYSYIAIFQWTDSQGNLHQSTPSIPREIEVTGSNNTVTASLSTAYLSKKPGVSVALFRTKASGSIYFQVSDPIHLTSADASIEPSVQIVDIFSDTLIEGDTQPYTAPGSAVIENSTPPPSMSLVPHNNRLFFRNDEDRNEIWYTKSVTVATGLSPSGFLIDEIDAKLGHIAALSEMDEKLVIWKQQGLFVQSGDGANDVGSGSTLSSPQLVPSDVGCISLKSTILTPKGIMFKSANGIYMIDRSLNVVYLGAEVEAYNSQVITSASLVPGKSQIRFLCSTGLTLVYDYIFNQWSTFTAHTGVSSSTWNLNYVYSTGSALLQETAGTYSDNGSAFAMLLQTSYLALASIQGFQRVRRLILLGDFTNGLSGNHKISIAAAYDFSTTFQPAVTYTLGLASVSKTFQYRERLPIQKCDSISLLIQEITTGSSLEYLDLTNISFEAGVKKGVNKLGAQYSVG